MKSDAKKKNHNYVQSECLFRNFLSTHLPKNGKYTEWENNPLV